MMGSLHPSGENVECVFISAIIHGRTVRCSVPRDQSGNQTRAGVIKAETECGGGGVLATVTSC